MNRFRRCTGWCLAALLTAAAPNAWAQQWRQPPRIAYVWPAGGREGETFEVTVGGQYLKDTAEVYVSGEGVRAEAVDYDRPPTGKELAKVREIWRKAQKKARAEAKDGKRPGRAAIYPIFLKMAKEQGVTDKQVESFNEYRRRRFDPKRQLNPQLAESVNIRVTIAAGTPPGTRELRLTTPNGLSNPLRFRIGRLPECRESEPNDKAPAATRVPSLPTVLNGQITPGDVDRFRFHARRGQQLVVDVSARDLIPYLADAVPGWFQATLALYDAGGSEVAFADDYRFNPDPVLFYKIPANGEYELEIRDSIYRGREDFVYRIAVSEQPFITQMFPLGGRAGVKTVASITGWNLPENELPLDTQPGGDCIRQTAYYKGKQISNSIPYAVDTLPECEESESNDTIEDAQQIDLPKIINGRITESGDIDVFKFEGRAGDKVVVEVCARRLNSPLDSLLQLTDASGKVLEWNDDHVLKESHLYKNMMGLITHHADSYLMTELPKDGTYYVHLADSQHHGGEAYGYRLRISPPQGDFTLRVVPSNHSVRAGGTVPIRVHALRKDGFEGDIEMVLKEQNAGFKLSGARIPAGRDSIRMTLTVPAKASDQPVALQLEGRARIDGKLLSHPVVPADEVMQAFLYRHLVPAQELLFSVQKTRWSAPPVELVGDSPVRIPIGGTAQVRLKTRRSRALKEMQLRLNEPPEGLTLYDVTIVSGGLAFILKADKDVVQSGFADNLIVEVFREVTPKQKDGKPAAQKRRYSMGVFPAIPIEIVQR